MRRYRAAAGAGFTDAEAQVYGTFLAKECGTARRFTVLSPEEIVALAAPGDSPIHRPIFYETEAEAAHQRRLMLARHLTNHITVVTKTPSGQHVTEKAFYSVTTKTDDGEVRRGYTTAEIVWKRPDLSVQVNDYALARLRRWVERYRTYSTLAGRLAAEIEELIDRLLREDQEGGEAEAA